MPPFMSASAILLLGMAAAAAALTAAWLVQRHTRNAGLVDAVWSWCLGSLGLLYSAAGSSPPVLRGLLAMLAGGWGLRLGIHLFLRNRGKPEDGRYRKMRERWGAQADRNMFWLFQLQAVLAVVLSVGFLEIAYRSGPPSHLGVTLALAVWSVSVIGEALADRQLERFRQNPANRGAVCRDGLWRYSRHPNYFFECLHWFAYPPLAYCSAWWWLTLVPPLLMAFLLLKVSGIAITERHLAASRPAYADYVRTTSAIVPWPPKKTASQDHPSP
jgi:cyclopropane-fatty-acyl-phospholipid synthase